MDAVELQAVGGHVQAIRPAKLAHFVLKTFDVERLRDWYLCVLSGRVAYEKLPVLCFLTYDDEHHRVGITMLPGEPVKPDDRAWGLHHTAFTFADVRTLLKKYEQLRDAGITPSITVNHGPTLSFYYADPDGNGVELQIDRFKTAEEAQAFIDANFDRNPAGVACDPEALLQKMRAGASDEELMHYDPALPMIKF